MKNQQESLSNRSLIAATRSRAKFSGHGNAKGAAGHNVEYALRSDCDILMKSGETMALNAPPSGFGDIEIGAVWDSIRVKRQDMLGKILSLKQERNVDLDLGCLYELNSGERGVIQAFGGHYGSLKSSPYIALSGDERTGKKSGYDEKIIISGEHWQEIKRVIVYVYIYEGIAEWAQVKPEIHILAVDKKPMIVSLSTHYEELNLCVISGIERVRSGMRITNFTEYFPGHSEMDRAYGFGIKWEQGSKPPAT